MCHKFLKSLTFFFVLSLLFPVGAVNAAVFKYMQVNFSVDDSGIAALKNPEPCSPSENLEQCPGVCAGKVTVNQGTLSLTTNYSFKTYKKAQGLPLLVFTNSLTPSVFEQPKPVRVTLKLNFTTPDNCSFILDGDSAAIEDVKEILVKMTYNADNLGPSRLSKSSYCCCKPDPQNKKKLSDCAQTVEGWQFRDTGKFTDGLMSALPICADTGFEPFPMKELVKDGKRLAACQLYEGAQAADLRAKQQLAAEKVGTLSDLRDQVAVLNKFPQFDSVPADKLGSAIIGRFIGIPLGILLGSVSLALYIIAGFIWMTAAGNSEKTQQAQQMVVWTSLGVAAILASYMLVRLVFQITTTGSL